ncbi:MAG: efflux RND transporter permease subunit [Sphingomonadales bacterium]
MLLSDISVKLPGYRAFPVMRQGLGGRNRKPVQFVIGGSSFEELTRWRDIILKKAAENPMLLGVDSDYRETKPQLMVHIDRDRAADLGVSIRTIGLTLETMMNSRRVTTYNDRGEEYDVKLQSADADRRQPSDLTNIYVRSESTGKLIPLSSFVTFENRADAGSLNRFNRMRAITISANLAPGYALGEALTFLEQTVAENLSAAVKIDYKGQSLEFKDSSRSLFFTFGLALLVVFLVLAAQFESFIHPLVIMMTAPLAVAGALIGLILTDGTLNVFSQIGIIMLIGLAAKNGILIVEFANQLRDAGRSIEDALIEAAQIRLRPILMTAFSTAIGAIPLMLATGAGEASLTTIGVVIFCGIILATFLTVFVIPVFYILLAKYTRSPGATAAELDQLMEKEPAPVSTSK